jgi:drug/metabolite transporter (DMT)-like permease
MSKSPQFNKAMLHMLAATFFFSVMNVCIKKISHIPPMEIVFFRCFISMIFCFAIVLREHLDWHGSNGKLLIARGVAGTTAIYTYFVTIQHMPLAPAVTLQYTSPIFTTLIALYILKEKVRWVQYVFFAVSFIGVLMIKGFNSDINIGYVLLGLFSAVTSGIAYNLVRSLKEKEHPIVIVLHFQLVGTVIGFLGCFFGWKMPQGMDWFYLLMIGVLTQLGQVNLTKSLQSERIAIVSSLNYLGILYALVFGVFFFGESYTLSIFMGIVLVVSGVLLNIIFGKKEQEIITTDE